MDKKDAKFTALKEFTEAFVKLFRDSDMRPEDECHDLYAQAEEALALEE